MSALPPGGAAPVNAGRPTEADRKPLSVRELRRLKGAVPRRLRFTREGKLLFFVTLGIGFGATNSGNNLLYLVLGILLSLIMISGVLSELTLRRITAVRFASPHLFVGEPALVRVDLNNEKARFTSFSVEVSELVAPHAGFEQRRGFVLSLGPGQSAPAHLRISAKRRGVLASAGLMVTTRFPFGFFEKSRIIPLPARYVVVPAVRPVPLPKLPPLVLGAEEQIARIGHGDEFYGLRDAGPGEDARSIAWKVSARRDKLIVREHQRPASRRVMLLVPNAIPPGPPVVSERFEQALSEAASLATVLSDHGYAVGLATCDGGRTPDDGHHGLVTLYETLAELPVRTVPPGIRVPIFDRYPRRNVERVALLTSDQQRAGISVDADRVVIVDQQDRASEGPRASGSAAPAEEAAA